MFGGIKKVIDNIHKDYPGMEPELRIPCICDTCLKLPQDEKNYYKYDKIVERLEGGKRTVECDVKPYDDVSVEQLLNHILRKKDYDKNYRKEVEEGEAKRIFVSYSHKDMAYKERLETAFAVQVQQGNVEIWNDQEILAGEEWNEEIFEHLESADAIVLLFSPDFFASNFIWEKELPVVMRRYQSKSAKVFPVLLRPCDWKDTEYGEIQAVPSDSGELKAISLWENEDEAWLTVVQGIKRAIK